MAIVLLILVGIRLLPAPPARAAGDIRPPHAPDRTGPTAAGAVATDAPVAALLRVDGDVELRLAGETRRGDGSTREALRAGDAVQTLTRSRAWLRVGAGDHLGLGERSILFFGAGDDDNHLDPLRRAALLAGRLSGSFDPGGDLAPFELELPGARLRTAAAPDDALRFLVSRDGKSGSSISVLSGRARLVRAHGAELLTAGIGVALDARGNVRERRMLPAPPDTLAPAGGSVVAYRAVPPRIAFTWSAVPRASHYRLRIARDPELHDLLVDERVDAAFRTLGGLHAGEYYWSVSAVDGRHEGRPSVPRRLRILRDADAPALAVDALGGLSGPILVRGYAEPGAAVYVQGEAVAVGADGAFERRIVRGPGPFLLRVEAVDSVGNVTSDSRVVDVRDDERATVAEADAGT
jgi:hypothetical protein